MPPHVNRRTWTDEDLLAAHAGSRSVSEILRKLGLRPSGGNYEFIQDHMERLSLAKPCPDRGWSRGLKLGPKRELDEFLVEGKRVNSDRLRKRLITEGIKQHKCESCGLTEWNDQPIPLELDHIDGDRKNNLLSNLRILCPNCHAQTPTYRGRNINR